MRRLAQVGLISTNENAAAQLVDDTTLRQYHFVQTAAGAVRVLGPIRYGETKRVIAIDPQREIRNACMVGGSTVEVIVLSTRYSVDIWNPEADYEGFAQGPQRYSYTSPAVLTSAYVDRTNVYTALVNKINAVESNNCKAYGLTRAEYTTGTDANSASGFIIGEIVTQETSSHTAQVAAMTMTSGTFAATTAAGSIWLYNLCTELGVESNTGWLETQKTLTGAGEVAATTLLLGSTNCVVTVTNATTYHYQGIVVVDDSGYFTSHKARGGINRVANPVGFTTAVTTTIIAGQYSIGIGTDMLAQRPVFDIGNQALISGDIELNFDGSAYPVAGQTYEKIIIECQSTEPVDPMSGNASASPYYYVLWFNDASHADHTHDLLTALDTAAAK